VNTRDPQEAQAASNMVRSTGYEFKGIDLEPFTPERQTVASEMGMTWPFMDESDMISVKVRIPLTQEEVDKLPKRNRKGANLFRIVDLEHYRQSFKDSIIVLWLMAQPVSRVKRAGRKPEEAYDEAMKWAAKISFSLNTELAGEALGLWIQISNEIQQSKSEPKNKDTGGPPEDKDSGEL
jgi:hypothetical protein